MSFCSFRRCVFLASLSFSLHKHYDRLLGQNKNSSIYFTTGVSSAWFISSNWRYASPYAHRRFVLQIPGFGFENSFEKLYCYLNEQRIEATGWNVTDLASNLDCWVSRWSDWPLSASPWSAVYYSHWSPRWHTQSRPARWCSSCNDQTTRHVHTTAARNQTDKKFSYRKQIARQLRTQYVEGIYSNSATLKSGSGSFKVIENDTI